MTKNKWKWSTARNGPGTRKWYLIQNSSQFFCKPNWQTKTQPSLRIEVLAEKCGVSRESCPFFQLFPPLFVFSLKVLPLPAPEQALIFSEMSMEEPFPRHRLEPWLSTGVLSCSYPKVPVVLCSVQPSTWKQAPEKNPKILRTVRFAFTLYPTTGLLTPAHIHPCWLLLLYQMQLSYHRHLQSRTGGNKVGFLLIKVANSELSIN